MDEVGGVQKKTSRRPACASSSRGVSTSASKRACSARRSAVSAGPGIAPVLRRRNPNFFSTLPTCAGLRSIPVKSAIRALASTRVRGGFCAKTVVINPSYGARALWVR